MIADSLGVEAQVMLSVTRMLGFFAFVVITAVALVQLTRSSPRTASRKEAESDMFEPIRQTDPAFTWEAFSARALAAYEVIQRARMVKQPNLAREWVTPAQLVGLENEEAYAQRADVDRTVAPIRVAETRPRSVRSDGSDFFIDMRIVADTTTLGHRALTNTPNAEIYLLEQDNAPAQVDEVWTFCRPIGSVTATGPVVPGHCANCGAPVEDPDAASCPYCGEAMRAADWLVSAIAPTDLAMVSELVSDPQSQTGAS